MGGLRKIRHAAGIWNGQNFPGGLRDLGFENLYFILCFSILPTFSFSSGIS
jgi:hypothetical protein